MHSPTSCLVNTSQTPPAWNLPPAASAALSPCMICPPLLPLSISQVLPWMVFLKWRSPAVARNPPAPRKKRETGGDVIQLPPRRPEMNSLLQWGTDANILNLNLAASISPCRGAHRAGGRGAFYGMTINAGLPLYLQVDPIGELNWMKIERVGTTFPGRDLDWMWGFLQWICHLKASRFESESEWGLIVP